MTVTVSAHILTFKVFKFLHSSKSSRLNSSRHLSLCILFIHPGKLQVNNVVKKGLTLLTALKILCMHIVILLHNNVKIIAHNFIGSLSQ